MAHLPCETRVSCSRRTIPSHTLHLFPRLPGDFEDKGRVFCEGTGRCHTLIILGCTKLLDETECLGFCLRMFFVEALEALKKKLDGWLLRMAGKIKEFQKVITDDGDWKETINGENVCTFLQFLNIRHLFFPAAEAEQTDLLRSCCIDSYRGASKLVWTL